MILKAGRTLGDRYRAVRMLGRGGMGEVWLCDDVERGGSVAVKVVRPDLLASEEQMRLFHGEVVAAARLCHPGIVAVFDLVRRSDAETFLVMAHRPGHPLSALLPEVRSFSFVREVLRQILAALAYAHARSVLHLDVKPDNVIAETRPDAVRTTLVDFGIARVRTPGVGIEKWLERDAVLGTLAYMAPEQCAGRIEQFGPWTDLYAVGAMGYEMCAGESPHSDVSGPSALLCRLTVPAPPLRSLLPDVPAEFADLCAWLLAIEPKDRPTHAADVLRALEAMPAGPLVVPEPSPARKAPASSSEATVPARSVDTTQQTAASGATDPTLRIEGEGPGPYVREVARFVRERTTGSLIRDAVADYARTLPAFGDESDPDPGAYGLFGLRELPLIGRDRERETIWHAVRGAILASRPHLVLLSGPAGVGKTRLARDAVERTHELGLCASVQTAWSADGSGDEGLRGLVENLLDSRGASGAGLRRRLSFWLERRGGGHPALEREVELLLRPPKEAALDAELPVRVAVDMIERAANERPVLLWMDDVQWSRGEAEALLRALCGRCEATPVCIVATARIESEDERACCEALTASVHEDRSRRVTMQHLEPDAARRLVRGLLDVDDELCAFLASRAEGNPLFVTQLLADLIEADAVERRDGRYRLAREMDLRAVPADISALWDRRLARSGADVRDLAAIALVRERVALDVVGELGRVLGRDLAPSIERAAEHGLLRITDRTLSWVHGLLRDHLVRSVDASARAALHRAAARALEPFVGREDVQEERARHLLAGGDPDAACLALIEAIGWSERRAENEARRRRIDLLLAWSVPDALAPHRVRALAELGLLLAQSGRRDDADAPIAEAMSIAKEHALDPAWLHVRRGQVARLLGRMEEGAEAANGALAAARRDGDRSAEAVTLLHIGIAAMRRGDSDSAKSRLAESAERFRALGDRAGEAQALCCLANLLRDQLDLFDRAVELANAAGALSTELSARQVRLGGLWECGQTDMARREAARIAEEARRRGLRQTVSLTELIAGCWAIRDGDVMEAERRLDAALHAGADSGAAPERAAAAALRLAVAAAAGRDADARSVIPVLTEARRSYDDEFLRRVLVWTAALASPELGADIRSLIDRS